MAVSDSVAIERFGFFVDGEARSPRHGEYFDSVDPTTGRAWAHVAAAGSEDVDECVRSAKAAFDGSWSTVAASERGLLLFRLADAIDADAERIAALETRENGKLYREMLAQMKLVPKWLRYFGGPSGQDRGLDDSSRPAERRQLHGPGAPRGGRRNHALELARLSVDDGGCSGARGGQHRGREAVRGDLDVDARRGAAGDGRRACRPAF